MKCNNEIGSLPVIFFVLTLAFSLTSTDILNLNTAVGIVDAFAKKAKESSRGSSNGDSGISGSSDKGGSSSSGGSDSKGPSDNNDNKNSHQGTYNNEQQQQEASSNDGSYNLQPVGPTTTGAGEQGTGPIVPAVKTTTPLPQTTCKQESTCTTTHQQNLSQHNHSTTTTKDKIPFVLSLPFP